MVRLSWIDQLVESGLCSKKKLPYARIVLSDVNQEIKSMVYRDLAVEIFTKLTNLILNDQVLYQRTRQLLMSQHHEETENIKEKKTLETIRKLVKEQHVEEV